MKVSREMVSIHPWTIFIRSLMKIIMTVMTFIKKLMKFIQVNDSH